MDRTQIYDEIQDNIALKLYENDESALSDILVNYAPALEAWLDLVYVKNFDVLTHEDIEDIVSVSITKLWNRRQCYNDKKGKIKTWLFRIAENTAKDLLKTNWHKAKQLESSVEQEYLEQCLCEERHLNQLNSNSNGGDNDKNIKAVQEALKELKDDYRKILMADAMADGVADSAKLGKLLGGLPSSTVRVYRSRAKKAFREAMEKRGFSR